MTDATSPAVDLLQRLIRCPSVTPAEGGALQLLKAELEAAGFRADLVVFSEPGFPDVHNLYARFGTAEPCFLFAGHTDVVPPGRVESWRHDPFAGVIEDGFVLGRGACDMKGGVAASVAAALDFLQLNPSPRGSIAFLITGDEEGPAVNGTPKLLRWALDRGERFHGCILGEPTNPGRLGEMIKNGRRGSLSGVLTVEGRQGHVAYPHKASNPLPALLRLCDSLLEKPLDTGTEHFDPSNLELVSLDTGNPSFNVIPAEARARFNIRFNDRWTPQSLADEVRGRLAGAGVAAPYRVEFEPTNALPFITEPGPLTETLIEAIEAETGLRPVLSTTGGTSDARFISTACPVVEFGLVGETMHAVDECASVADLEALTRIYRRVLEATLAG